VVEFWDEHVWQWLSGADPMADPLPEWYASYAGSGPGIVTRDGFVEPYLGDFLGHESEPRLVIMGLNPGYFDPPHQARDGMFADEIRDEYGSYSAWARSCPYDRDAWTAAHGPNNYFRSRLNFTRTWLDDAAATMNDMLVVELYPWHSARVTSAMHPPADVLTAFVWEPLAELAVRHYFAFGRPWVAAATELGLDLTAALGRGGNDYHSAVPSRAVRVYTTPTGHTLVVEWHAGSAGPPRASEVEILRHALWTL
jgi:hypothetical protein